MFTTYERQLELCSKKLAIKKEHGDLVLFKYHRNVMYDYKWFDIPELMECRGHVYSKSTGNIVQAPVRKSFNYLENGWWKDVPLDTLVRVEKKYNGYMAAATRHNGELLVTTTGSFGGDYQEYAYEILSKEFGNIAADYTDLYEIIADWDPHIVDEGKSRAIYIGSRCKKTGAFYPTVTAEGAFKVTLREAIQMAQIDRGEGFMVYIIDDFHGMNIRPAKLKTPYYAGKKKLMRANARSVHAMYDNPKAWYNANVPLTWKDTVYHIVNEMDKELWLSMNEQVRRKYLEDHYV